MDGAGDGKEEAEEAEEAEEMSKIRRWLDALLPKVVRSAGQGLGEYSAYELSVPSGSFFLSSMFFVRLRFGAQQPPLNLVVKRLPLKEGMSEALNAHSFFHDEILFYRDFAKHFDNCPRHVYVEEKPPRDSVIVLENLEDRGYRACPARVNAPLDHTLAAVRAIGRFHAKGYIMKERRPGEFFGLVGKIRDSRFGELDPRRNRMIDYVNLMSPRPLRYLRRTGYDPAFCDRLEPLFESAFERIMLDAAKPVEPLATLCHGDLTLNNVLFKAPGSGQPSALLIDFAMIRYGTPAIDLATLLLLCCSRELRREHLPLVLRAYHESLLECLREAELPDLRRFSYEAIYRDYTRRALFGFVITVFFLPISRGLSPLTPEEMVCLPVRRVAEMTGDLGGDEMSQALADTLLELRELGSLDHILQSESA